MIASCEASSKHQPVALATNFKMRFSQTSVCVQFDPEIPKTVAISCRSNAASCHFCLPMAKRDRQWEQPGQQPLRTGARNGHSSATASATRPPGFMVPHDRSSNDSYDQCTMRNLAKNHGVHQHRVFEIEVHHNGELQTAPQHSDRNIRCSQHHFPLRMATFKE